MAGKGGKDTGGHGGGHGKDDKPKVIVKKARGHHGGHHGGAWKVAYADFVTAMMALFLVLWLLGATNSQEKAVIAQYFRDPGVFTGSKGLIPNGGEDKLGQGMIAIRSMESMGSHIKEKISGMKDLGDLAEQVPVEITPDGLQIEIIDKDQMAFFEVNNANITPIMKKVLDLIAEEVKDIPNKIAIAGHTDSRPFGNSSYYSNWELSSARALNTRRVMEDDGIDPGRFAQVVGHADRKLRVSRDPNASENRRISILVMKLDKNDKKPERPANETSHPESPKSHQADAEQLEHTQYSLELVPLEPHTEGKLDKAPRFRSRFDKE